MVKNKPKTKYDPDADVLSIEVSGQQKIDYATEVGDLVVHFSKSNRPILVEVLNASRFLKSCIKLVSQAH